MENVLINADFERSIKTLRRILPKLSFGLLIGTYLISALIMGIFHAQNASNTGMMVAAFLIPLAIQAGRGTLVFFFQLNPARMQQRLSMAVIAATSLLVLSMCEAWLVMSPHGWSWIVSVATLMVIGWILEIMILKETMFASQMQLYQNVEQWQELQKFYLARAELGQFMKDIREGKRPELPFVDAGENRSGEQEPDTFESINGEIQNPTAPGKSLSPSLNGRY
ncbi:MAG: hypothetical protein AAFO96_28425 [Bacteroidota bacterium]